MLIRIAILGLILICAVHASALGQNATYVQPPTDVGNLSSPGVVGRSDPFQTFGRVGGRTTGRFDLLPPQFSLPSPAFNNNPNRGFSPMGRPRGLFDPGSGAPGYAGSSNRIPSKMEFKPRSTNQLSSFENNKYQTYITRHQQARGAIATPDIRDTGVLADWRAVMASRNRMMTPIERLHSFANLLKPKSPLAQIVSTNEMAIYNATTLKPSHTTPPPADSEMVSPEDEGAPLRAFDNAMAERLQRKYEEYKANGLAFFRARNFIRARDCFDICRSLDRKRPWPYAIDTLVAMETNEYGRAVNSLMGALSRTASLDDLHLDIKQLYAVDLDFEKCVNNANYLAGMDNAPNLAGKDNVDRFKVGHLLQSYCAWLKGDLAAAASAAQTAAKSINGEPGKNVQRYADQLKERAANPPGLR